METPRYLPTSLAVEFSSCYYSETHNASCVLLSVISLSLKVFITDTPVVLCHVWCGPYRHRLASRPLPEADFPVLLILPRRQLQPLLQACSSTPISLTQSLFPVSHLLLDVLVTKHALTCQGMLAEPQAAIPRSPTFQEGQSSKRLALGGIQPAGPANSVVLFSMSALLPPWHTRLCGPFHPSSVILLLKFSLYVFVVRGSVSQAHFHQSMNYIFAMFSPTPLSSLSLYAPESISLSRHLLLLS